MVAGGQSGPHRSSIFGVLNFQPGLSHCCRIDGGELGGQIPFVNHRRNFRPGFGHAGQTVLHPKDGTEQTIPMGNQPFTPGLEGGETPTSSPPLLTEVADETKGTIDLIQGKPIDTRTAENGS